MKTKHDMQVNSTAIWVEKLLMRGKIRELCGVHLVSALCRDMNLFELGKVKGKMTRMYLPI